MRLVTYGKHGWVRVDGIDGLPAAYAHTVEKDGRRLISRLMLLTDPWPPGVTSATLKSFPIGWLERMINTPAALATLNGMESDSPRKDPLAVAIHKFSAEFLFGELPEVLDDEAPKQKLSRPDGSDPEAFYRLVAERYVAELANTKAVAPALADEAGVPVPTVHRWIAEARRRGHLPPARRGRAG
ncbi:hypothetical protein O7635_27830 [Asanoa sp. WMMD1127]|uniref:hypothetical protein n=1 Tax=Asanoa sp. WMMD1127 TaxID=3016107 RepID=UPI002417074D|nr:hypothetical protein [Asanoa sp. WMMD1127]MDG4825673.1 hypothetical protein [Asanoa sp. WMMD1127]